MVFTGYELVWLFFVYSFLGWILETTAAAVKQKRLVNRGLINGPFCVIYGIAAVVITVSLQELRGFWLFVGVAILATVIEWTAGRLIERFYHERWWDYSNIRWNLDGYICVPYALLWGVLGFFIMNWGNSFLLKVFYLLPAVLGKIILWGLLAVLAVDIAATLIILIGRSRWMKTWEATDAQLTRLSFRMAQWIYEKVDVRLRKAYPEAKSQEMVKRDATVFASGCSFYKIVLLFFIGAFIGDLVETVFCRLTAGVWMSRSSVVWGPFSIVWGLAIAAVTVLMYRYKDSSDGFLFAAGTFLGGAYEYVCSVFTELVFGTVFWDYSKIPFNLGGRINLLYCFFWGIAAVVWLKKLYPVLSAWIEKIPMKPGKILTWVLIVFMSVNAAVSSMAMIRYDERSRGIRAEKDWQQTMDERFPNERMERIYPNALRVD